MPPKHPKLLHPHHASRLDYNGTYICPICRHGQVEQMSLMEAFSCNFCRHIFTANLEQQVLQVVDSSQPMSWRWTGRGWHVAYRDDLNLTLLIWFIAVILVTLPVSVVWLATYLFPALPGSPLSWFPNLWVGFTLGIHLLMVAWLLAEHYQLPLYVASRVRLRHWLSRR
jgi:hypothetical protein